MGIDLGSANTRIWVEEKGLLLSEPTLIAVDQSNNRVIAVGKQAAQMKGRADSSIKVFSPVQAPKFTDEQLLKAMLKLFLAKVSNQVYFFSPTILVSLSGSFYPSMKQVLTKVLIELGAGEVMLINQTLAAMIGAGVPMTDSSGSFVLQLGAGVVEVAGLSLGKVVDYACCNQGGLLLSEEIIYWFATTHKLKISEAIALKVLEQAGTLEKDEKRSIKVVGVDAKSGEPVEKIIFSDQLIEVLAEFGQGYLKLVKGMLSTASPDLTIDILDKGLFLSGGLAQLHGLEEYLTQGLKLPVFLTDEPELTVIKGVGLVLEHLDEFRQSLGY